MDALKLIFFSLLAHFAIGALVPLLLISVEEMGTMFFRLISILSIILLACAFRAHPFVAITFAMPFAAASSHESQVVTLLAASVFFLALTIFLLNRGGRIFAALAILTGLTAMAKLPSAFSTAAGVPSWMAAGSFMSAALLLGSVLGTMITGHWYLVNRKLTIRPLQIATWVFIGLAALRAVFVIATVAGLAASSQPALAETAKSLLDFSMAGILFWARVGFGLAIPLIFGWMIWSSVKVRNTQSATGILYATIVLILVGEAFAKYLYLFTGIPV
ncbi:MAG: hypothetical protein ONB46_09890 [candidate division KSB1 bacterium]|nr:hypothetical protein [candidate division KSB1 bacterium]MDZ7366114.1 hypothetical protein [candidate division KSB1 bacterium]MDZ7404244.1 hypothetical protein [candidate division KSB1 bacterium]